MAAKIHENRYIQNLGFLRNPADRTKIAPIFEQMTPNLLTFERYELYLCDIRPKLGPFSYFKAQILVRSQKFQISRYSIFSGEQTLLAPGSDPKIFLDPKTVFAALHMSTLEF